MRITRIKVHNIMGFEDWECLPGALNVFEGDNGVGKTTAVSAIKIALGGGEAKLVREGADEGEIVLIWDHGDLELTSKITRDAKQPAPVLRQRDRRRINEPPASFLHRLFDMVAVNPVAFLTAPEKEQARILLETMPLYVTPEEIDTALQGVRVQVPDDVIGDPNSEPALDVIDRVSRSLYDTRTGVNRLLKEKRQGAAELERTLPTKIPEVPNVGALRAQERATVARVEQIKASGQQKLEVRKQQLRTEAQQKIDKIKTDLEGVLEQATRNFQAQTDELVEAASAELGQLQATITTIDQQARERDRALAARQLYDKTLSEAGRYADEAEGLTQALAKLQALREGLLSRLPIKCLEIRKGEIFVDGVPFSILNDANRALFAVKVALLRSSGPICVDDLEKLSPRNFAAFEQAALEAARLDPNIQFFVTRVTPGPLTVRAEGTEGEVNP